MAQIKKILVPNDFSINPIILLKKILEENQEDNFRIVLLHGIYTPDSIMDLLFYNKKKVIQEMENPAFLKACDLFRSKFDSRIISMHSDVITSIRRHAFNAYLEVNEIDDIYIPEGFEMDFSQKDSFDVVKLIKRARVAYNTISFDMEPELVSSDKTRELSQLLLTGFTKSIVRKYEGNTALS